MSLVNESSEETVVDHVKEEVVIDDSNKETMLSVPSATKVVDVISDHIDF